MLAYLTKRTPHIQTEGVVDDRCEPDRLSHRRDLTTDAANRKHVTPRASDTNVALNSSHRPDSGSLESRRHVRPAPYQPLHHKASAEKPHSTLRRSFR
jgi:hypothetical protein